MNLNESVNREEGRLLKTISEAGEPLFDIYENDGIYTAKLKPNAFISNSHVQFVIGAMDHFARERKEKVLLMMDFSAVAWIEKEALLFLSDIEEQVNKMEPLPYFLAATTIVPENLLVNLFKP